MTIAIVRADYTDPRQAADIVYLLDSYAQEDTGGGEPLPERVKQNLVAELAQIPTAFTVLAYVDDRPAGLANCFHGFSTFACRPLINIHDLMVAPALRGLGLSQMLLDEITRIGREKGCCKITLEVLEGNTAARRAYEKFGFAPYVLNSTFGKALFLQKPLIAD